MLLLPPPTLLLSPPAVALPSSLALYFTKSAGRLPIQLPYVCYARLCAGWKRPPSLQKFRLRGRENYFVGPASVFQRSGPFCPLQKEEGRGPTACSSPTSTAIKYGDSLAVVWPSSRRVAHRGLAVKFDEPRLP